MKEENCGIETVFDEGEIGAIGNLLKETVNYNLSLNTKLNEARIRERDAQLLLLQSQINPHFLYNTLDSLYCMAIIDNADDVAEMVSALSDMFKLSLIRGKRFLPLKEELEYVKKYMQIQNMRYKDRFETVFSVRDQAEDYYILKFLIQPFVENAVYHGLEPKIGEGKVEVSCWLDGALYISVKDNGVGAEDCRQIENGYGINNVKERIRLFYGENYGISIKSKKGEGTEVVIRIPPWGKEQYRAVMREIKY
nr:sensor histidine kinase [Clostridium sp. MCC353]